MEHYNSWFPWCLWKINLSISHFLWTQPCCKLKQQHVGTLTFQHCQILYHPFGQDRTNKRLKLLPSLSLHLFNYLPLFPLNPGYRIHPYLVGLIIWHDAHHRSLIFFVSPLFQSSFSLRLRAAGSQNGSPNLLNRSPCFSGPPSTLLG